MSEKFAKLKPRGTDYIIFRDTGDEYMSYDEEQQKRSRVVIETPTARREVVQTVTARAPERRGVSTGVVAALVIGAVALVTLLFLFILNRQQNNGTEVTANVSTAATPLPQQPVVIQQQPTPLPQTPIIIQQPGTTTTTTQPPIIIEQPAPVTTTAPATATSGNDDATIQSAIDKKMAEDATLSTVGVTVTVSDGKATLIGTVDTPALKNQVERLVKSVKGVRAVDSQIIVSGG
jgi:hyperosmotically inducible periplasmic protein